MTVYLDLVMVLNFLVDFLLLLGTNRLAGFPAQPWRCAAAALLGAVYSGVCLLPGMLFLGNFLWRGVFLGVMGGIAFGFCRGSLKRVGIFLLLTMAMGGAAMSLGRGDFLSLVLCALLCLLLSVISFGGQVGGREYVPLQISQEGRTVNLIALKDTGNTLRDPVTGSSVLVADAESAQELLGLSRAQLADPVGTVASGVLPGLRLIPYRAVGISGGMLVALRMEGVRIGKWKGDALVAFAPEGLGGRENYRALTGGMV
jgi:stage II sporulation protein GA (sporulation sigma-E factor processing peptidase)